MIRLRSMYSPCRAFTRASSRAALASSSVAKPPTHRGLLIAGLGVLDADHVRPGGAALHDAIAEPGRVLAGGCGHQAAVLSASSLETYSSRAVSGMRRDPSMRIEAMAPLASSS